jgi:DNA-binding PadR family transcriptional regulator
MKPPPLPLGAWAIVALLCEEDAHGWRLVRALAPGGEIGQVWSIRRALVYRTIEQVSDAGLAERAGVEPGSRGSPRTLLRPTRSGRQAVARWLAEPVEHVRDLRSELLLKLLFTERSDGDATPLLRAQRALLTEAVAALDAGVGDGHPFDATLRAFRSETASAGLRFVVRELDRRGERREAPNPLARTAAAPPRPTSSR